MAVKESTLEHHRIESQHLAYSELQGANTALARAVFAYVQIFPKPDRLFGINYFLNTVFINVAVGFMKKAWHYITIRLNHRRYPWRITSYFWEWACSG